MIERAIYSLLVADEDVAGFVGDRIYPDIKDDDQVGAYLVITKVGGRRPLYLDNSPKQAAARIQIDAFDEDAERVSEIADAVIDLFHGHGAQADGHDIQIGELQSEPKSGYDDDTGLRKQMMEFVFHYS